ncbi:MAG: hypothetical protein WA941_15020 [Nitrososphaeraceae archaeon]
MRYSGDSVVSCYQDNDGSYVIVCYRWDFEKKPTKIAEHLDAPIATSGNNTYIAWWTNETGNDEVMLRSSLDGGSTFSDKINLSNTTDINSQDVEIAAEGDNIVVTWWERNATSNEPVIRISTDNGQTFGPLLKLAANGTISSGEQTQ